MLNPLGACLPIAITNNSTLQQVGETSFIVRIQTSGLDKNEGISLQARNMVARTWLSGIKLNSPHWLVDYVLAYDSLLLEVDASAIDFNGLFNYLRGVEDNNNSTKKNASKSAGKLHEIEVCYQYSGNDYPNDMLLVEAITGLNSNEIIQLHQGLTFQVFAIGFMPNFAYLGELSPKLHVPRLKEPRLKVPAGAVAITDNQTAVYPQDSPGGWHIIGYTNFIFGSDTNNKISSNDCVVFKAVDLCTFTQDKNRLSTQ